MAQRGGPGLLLVQTRVVDKLAWGRIWNVHRGEMGRETPVDAILKFGYWEAYTGPQPSAEAMASARAIGGFDGDSQGRQGQRGQSRASR